jgi:hypothetical protein
MPPSHSVLLDSTVCILVLTLPTISERSEKRMSVHLRSFEDALTEVFTSVC